MGLKRVTGGDVVIGIGYRTILPRALSGTSWLNYFKLNLNNMFEYFNTGSLKLVILNSWLVH